MEKVCLKEKFDSFDEHWTPKIIAELNGQLVKVAKMLGKFEWHTHENEDELFLVIRGELVIHFRNRSVTLLPGEMIVVPKGVEHMPEAPEEVEVVMFEPVTTLNTGDSVSSRTVEKLDRI